MVTIDDDTKLKIGMEMFTSALQDLPLVASGAVLEALTSFPNEDRLQLLRGIWFLTTEAGGSLSSSVAYLYGFQGLFKFLLTANLTHDQRSCIIFNLRDQEIERRKQKLVS